MKTRPPKGDSIRACGIGVHDDGFATGTRATDGHAIEGDVAAQLDGSTRCVNNHKSRFIHSYIFYLEPIVSITFRVRVLLLMGEDNCEG
jgi:hypothetical protein